MTVGAPAVGEVLAGRYRLEEHINVDAHGRHVWRGIDVVLRRPVAIVLRQPGGAAAGEMLSAAVAASRITHPHLVDVYDAIDEGARAYVVREWVDGASLRELVTEGPLDAGRATAVAHAVASAVSAAHATGMVHGNVHPGTVLFADDGRVVLADARADERATPVADVRAIGGILYCALTGHWPHAELGPDRLPDGVRNGDGSLASPRQVRGGLPSYLSEMATDLINPRVTPPTADDLAAELGRLDTDNNDELFGDSGPLNFNPPGHSPGVDGRGRVRKIAIGVTALLALSVASLIVAAKLTGTTASGPGTGGNPTSRPSATATSSVGGQQPPIKLSASQVRIVDPPTGDRSPAEINGAGATVDGDPATSWSTQKYNSAPFGHLKPGMGVLIDLGAPTDIVNVTVKFSVPGATVSAYVGDKDPGATRAGDKQIMKSFTQVGSPQVAGSSLALPIGLRTRFVMVFISSLPPIPDDPRFQVAINEIIVNKG
jgi:serine/threonine protein kinase